MTSWTYEIVFDSDFLCIVSGGVIMSRAEFTSSMPLVNNTSSYGETLNYINAAVVQRLRGDHNSGSPTNTQLDESQKQIIANEIKSIRDRLNGENAPTRTISLLMEAARGALSQDMIDYNL